MAITYDGALNFGPDSDDTRYQSTTGPTIPAGDFALFFIVKVPHLIPNGDPTKLTTIKGAYVVQNFPAGNQGTASNDCFLRFVPTNYTTSGAANRRKLAFNIKRSTQSISSGEIVGTTQWLPGDTLVVVIQSNAGTIELKSCAKGSATVTAEASVARNGSFTAGTTGTWDFGKEGWANTIQTFGHVAQVLSDADIVALAAGTDPETVVSTSGNRTDLFLFNSVGSTIAATWGAKTLTRAGTWTNQIVSSPVIGNATTRIEPTVFPKPYSVHGCAADGSAATIHLTGTYTGFTPATFEYRVDDRTGTQVQTWASLANFTAGAGVWAGDAAVPVGAEQRLQIRDSVATSTILKSSVAFSVGALIGSMGQSPHARMESTYTGLLTVTSTAAYMVWDGARCIGGASALEWMKVTTAAIGAGMAAVFNHFHTATSGKPIGALLCAVTGTSSGQWATDDSGIYTNLKNSITQAGAQNILWNWLNGAAEAGMSGATIKANHDTIFSNLTTDLAALGCAFRYQILPHQRDTTATDANNYLIRKAQYEWARDHAQAGTKVLIGWWGPDMQANTEAVGTAQAGGASTITLAATDDNGAGADYNGLTVVITGGTGAGQTRTSTGYVVATKVLTVGVAWSTVPDATSTYKLYANSSHQNNLQGYQRVGPRYSQQMAYRYGLVALSGMGPTISTVTYPFGGDGSILDVHVTHRHGTALQTPNGGTDGAGLAGWKVSEDSFSTLETISSAVITGTDTIRITLSAPPSNKANLKVRYGMGGNVAPVDFNAVEAQGLGDFVYDNTSSVDSVLGGLPLYFTVDDVVPTEAAGGAAATGAGFLVLV